MLRLAPLMAAAAATVTAPSALQLKPCVVERTVPARCGTLAVPEDRLAPGGRTISVYVEVVPASGGGPHAEPIFYLAGGPGGAAASGDAPFATQVFRAATRTRDLVLVDQRGVGRSTPLVCPGPPAAPTDAELVAYARGCIASVGHDARLYTTDAAVDDLDAVRQALGYSKIVLYGASYGATAAQVYLARHGDRVQAAVLDGGTLLDLSVWERLPAAAQQAMDALAARCAASAGCHAAFPDVLADLATTLARVRANPTRIRVGDDSVPFGPAEVETVVELMQRAPGTVARLPLVLHQAANGDLDALTSTYRMLAGPDPVRLMYYAIRCAEGWSRTDPAVVAELAAGSYFEDAALADATTTAAVCPLLGDPIPAPDTGAVPQSRVPVLFLVGGLDPQDPLANVAAAPASLPRASILVVPGASHGSLQWGCLPAVASRFFAHGRLAAADRACAAAVRPPAFVLS